MLFVEFTNASAWKDVRFQAALDGLPELTVGTSQRQSLRLKGNPRIMRCRGSRRFGMLRRGRTVRCSWT